MQLRRDRTAHSAEDHAALRGDFAAAECAAEARDVDAVFRHLQHAIAVRQGNRSGCGSKVRVDDVDLAANIRSAHGPIRVDIQLEFA